MTKRMMSKLLVSVSVLTLASVAAAAGPSKVLCPPDAPPPATTPAPDTDKEVAIIDLENKKCPIMGGDAEKDVYTDYQGVRVHFCCKGCDRTFLKDPAKYLKVLGIDDLEQFKKERRAPK